jgi:hypothetical protein
MKFKVYSEQWTVRNGFDLEPITWNLSPVKSEILQ